MTIPNLPHTFELLRGAEVGDWIGIQANRRGWDELQTRSGWGTVFQTHGFLKVWMSHYSPDWEPILVIAKNHTKSVSGLMPLARRNEFITGAGAHQAEYQGWLSEERHAEYFLLGAFRLIREKFPRHTLRLRYLPAGAPSELLQNLAEIDKRIEVKVHDCPILDIDTHKINEILKKSSNKSKMNRLQREGPLSFRKLSDADFVLYADEIASMCDFRQGSVNDSCPFTDDSRKKAFHIDWKKALPHQLHMTGMFSSGRLVGALVLVDGGADPHVAILCYAPDYARHSPGKLHVYLAALMLANEGKSSIDLTPGGDAWKERFATKHKQVFELIVYPTLQAAIRVRLLDRAEKIVRSILKQAGLSPQKLEAGLRKLSRVDRAAFILRARRLLPRRSEYRVYRMSLPLTTVENAHSKADNAQSRIEINSLGNLLRFTPSSSWQTRQKFLSDALERIESGSKSYSISDGQQLVHSGWLSELGVESYHSEIGQRFRYPTPGALLFDFFSPPASRGRGHYRNTILRMVNDLSERGEANVAYISVLADNFPSRYVIEELGFEHFHSLYRFRFFWFERKWQSPSRKCVE